MFLAIDPGSAKCGWALFGRDNLVAGRGIWPRGEVGCHLGALILDGRIDLIVLGNRTGHRDLLSEIAACPGWRGRVHLVDEDRSSEEARRRCVQETTRGWRRLIPVSLRFPDRPYDDYVAVILGERYLAGHAGDDSAPPGTKRNEKERRGG